LEAWSQESLSLPVDSPLASMKSKFINSLLLQILPTTPLLNDISKLQRCLDSLDCEGLARLAEMECTHSASLGGGKNVVSPNANFAQPTMEDWELFVDRFLSLDQQTHSSFCPSNLHYHMLAYTLSATFKDCSLIIPLYLGEVSPKPGSIKVIDLDIKSLNRIPGWMKLDEKIVKEYVKLEIGIRKRCIEGRF
jgi:inositol-pentakisphosphate 2-kinase